MLLAFIEGKAGLDLFLSWLIAMTIGLTVHEYSHAKRAEIAGDRTPRAYGRVTLNPLAHFDLLGTALLLIFGWGWGKPVPINPLAFRRPRQDMIAVSLAGIAANFITAFVAALPLRLGWAGAYALPLAVIVYLNLVLAVFNALPVPPLDGSQVLPLLLPGKMRYRIEQFYARQGQLLFVLLLLLVFGGLVREPVRLLFHLFTDLPAF